MLLLGLSAVVAFDSNGQGQVLAWIKERLAAFLAPLIGVCSSSNRVSDLSLLPMTLAFQDHLSHHSESIVDIEVFGCGSLQILHRVVFCQQFGVFSRHNAIGLQITFVSDEDLGDVLLGIAV